MTQFSAFGTHGNGVTGPATSVSFGAAFVAGMSFEVTTSSQFLFGYLFWRADTPQPSTASFALWQITAANTGTYLGSGTAATGTGFATATWNFVPLATPFALTANTPYEAVYGVTGNFCDTNAGTNSFIGSYTAGITNGPLNVYSPPASFGGTNAVPFANSWQGAFGTSGADPTTNYPTSSDGNGANFWVDVLVGPAASVTTAAPVLAVSRTETMRGRGSTRITRR